MQIYNKIQLERGEYFIDKNRVFYIDNLRLFIIIIVVIQHAAVTYSGFGMWYYIEKTQLNDVEALAFWFFEAFNQAYFMGFLFLIAGFFTPISYDKKGFKKFMKDRLIRLGIPLVIYMLVIHPSIYFLIMGYRADNGGIVYSYSQYITSLFFLRGFGQLWFAFILLIFSTVYALLRKFNILKPGIDNKEMPKTPQIIMLILIISVFAFLIRWVQPIGNTVFTISICYFSGYIILFTIGIKSKRNGWFDKIKFSTGKLWLTAGIVLGTALFFVVILCSGISEDTIYFLNGNLHWQSFAFALWESFVAVSMSIGLISLFKEKFNKQNKLVRIMSNNAFSVYVFHSPILVILALIFKPVILDPITKAILLSIVSVPVCFLCVNMTIQRVPALRKLFAQ